MYFDWLVSRYHILVPGMPQTHPGQARMLCVHRDQGFLFVLLIKGSIFFVGLLSGSCAADVYTRTKIKSSTCGMQLQ